MLKVKRVAMKLLGLCLLLSSVISCQQDDVYHQSDNSVSEFTEGKTSVMNQNELMNRYSGDNLGGLLKNSFEQENSVQTTMSSASTPVYIDLDHIQVYESPNIHAITYHVVIGDMDKNINGEPQTRYNLVYYSKDYINYYVTLLRYDFSTTSLERFIQNPSDIMSMLSFVPLNDIENIYDNIAYSYSEGLRSTTEINPISFPQFIDLSDCAELVVEEGTPCAGRAKHEYGESCSKIGSERATPSSTYMDFSDCFDSPIFGGGGSGGGGGSFPGTPTPDPEPINPIKGSPIKKIGDFVYVGDFFAQINIGNNNQNVKTLKAIKRDIKADLQYFNSNLNLAIEIGKGYQFKTINGVYTKSLTFDLQNPSLQKPKIDMTKARAYLCGVFHIHPIKLGSQNHKHAPLFSPADLRAIFRFTNVSSAVPDRKPSEAFIGVVNKYGAYVVMLPNDVTQDNIATKYEDFISTNNNGRIFGDEDKEVWKEMEEKLEKEYNKIDNSSSYDEDEKKVEHEKALLEIMKEYGLDLNLYFLAKDEGEFDGSWQKVSLNTYGGIQYTTIN